MTNTLTSELSKLYNANIQLRNAKYYYKQWFDECAPYILLSGDQNAPESERHSVWNSLSELDDFSDIPDFDLAKDRVTLAREAIERTKLQLKFAEEAMKDLSRGYKPTKSIEQRAKEYYEFLDCLEPGLQEWVALCSKNLIKNFENKWNTDFYEKTTFLKKILNKNNAKTKQMNEERLALEDLLCKMNDCVKTRDVETLEALYSKHYTHWVEYKGHRYMVSSAGVKAAKIRYSFGPVEELKEAAEKKMAELAKKEDRLRSYAMELHLDYENIGPTGVVEGLKNRLESEIGTLNETIRTSQQAWTQHSKTQELKKAVDQAILQKSFASRLSTGETVPDSQIDQIMSINEKIRNGLADNVKEALIQLNSEALEHARYEDEMKAMAEHNAAMQELERLRNDELKRHNDLIQSYRIEELEELRDHNSAMLAQEHSRLEEELASNQRMYALKEEETIAQLEVTRAIKDEARIQEEERLSVFEDNINRCSNCIHYPSAPLGPDTYCLTGGCKLKNSGNCQKYMYAG